jgi:hypothetical protein
MGCVCSLSKPEACVPNTPPDRTVARVAGQQHGVISVPRLRATGRNRTAIAVRVRNARLRPSPLV